MANGVRERKNGNGANLGQLAMLVEEAGELDDVTACVDWAIDHIQSCLNDPESFRLTGDITPPHPVKYSDGKWAWQIDGIYYRARNGFGGYVTRHASLTMRKRAVLASGAQKRLLA